MSVQHLLYCNSYAINDSIHISIPSVGQVLDNEDSYYTEDVVSMQPGSGKMILLEPRAFSESQQIADHLKKRNTVISQQAACEKKDPVSFSAESIIGNATVFYVSKIQAISYNFLISIQRQIFFRPFFRTKI